MTKEQAKKNLAFIQAYAEGKTIEFRCNNGPWCSSDYLGFENDYAEYRIKPEPKLRPWKPEEVPVGALLKRKLWDKNKHPVVILGVDVSYSNTMPRAILSGPLYQDSYESNYFLSHLLTYHGGCGDQNQYSVDHGKTWLPCGVMEE